MASTQMSEQQNVQANALSRSITANTSNSSMNTLENDRKNYTLQKHVVRLHTFAKHAERKQNTSWKKT